MGIPNKSAPTERGILSRWCISRARDLIITAPGPDHSEIGSSLPDIPLKELVCPQHLIDPLPVVSAPRKLMRGPRMPDIFHRSSQYLETAIQHFSLHKTGPPVVLPMKNDQRRGNIFYIGDRRFMLQHGPYIRLPGIAPKIIRYQPPGIPLAKERCQIIPSALRTCRLEPVIMPHDPSRQITGIRPAAHHQPRRVGPTLRDRLVQRGQHIGSWTCPPIFDIGPKEIKSIPARTSRITIDDAVSPAAKILEFMPHRRLPRPPHRGWAAMDIQQERVM